MNNDLCKNKLDLSSLLPGLDISLQVMTEILSPEEKSKLKILHRASLNRKQGDKIKALLLLDQGYEYAEIARILLIDQSTVLRWYESFITAGITGLLKDNYVGGTCKLTEVQLDKLIEHLECTMYLTANRNLRLCQEDFQGKAHSQRHDKPFAPVEFYLQEAQTHSRQGRY